MARLDHKTLKHYAAKYIWWKTPDEAEKMPERVVAQVMNIGDYDDVQALAKAVGESYLREILDHTEAGVFSDKSWAYWHYRLGLCKPDRLPPMPQRRFE